MISLGIFCKFISASNTKSLEFRKFLITLSSLPITQNMKRIDVSIVAYFSVSIPFYISHFTTSEITSRSLMKESINLGTLGARK
jgi:hypothetical protein